MFKINQTKENIELTVQLRDMKGYGGGFLFVLTIFTTLVSIAMHVVIPPQLLLFSMS